MTASCARCGATGRKLVPVADGHASPPDRPVLLPEPIAPDDGGARLLTFILTDAAERITATDQTAAAEREG